MTLTLGTENCIDIDNGFFLDASLLREPGAHLFIASHHWETLFITNLSGIPDLRVSVFPVVADKVLVSLPDTVTESMVRLLVSIYPSKAGSIRKCYFTKGNMREVLKECLIQ